MPAGDGTGTAGWGPMTGRAAGYCAGYALPGFMNPVYGGRRGARAAFPRYGLAPYGYPYGAAAYSPFGGYAYPPVPLFGRGFGRGRGWGRGRSWRRGWSAWPSYW